MSAQCCCGKIKPCDEPLGRNDYLHEPFGPSGNFCGPMIAHTNRDLIVQNAAQAKVIEGLREALVTDILSIESNSRLLCEWLEGKKPEARTRVRLSMNDNALSELRALSRLDAGQEAEHGS